MTGKRPKPWQQQAQSPRVPQINHTKILKEADSEIYSNEQNDPFMYMPVKCGETNIAALIDTGSSINILSVDLFNSLPENCKSRIYPFHEEIKLANGHHIKIIGTADLKIRTDKVHTIKTYLLPKTSHPMILGINYLRSKHISIIFKDFPSWNNYKIKADRRLLIDANSELIIWGQLSRYLSVGLQGVCVNNEFLLRKGLLLAKTFSYNSS